MTNPKVVVEVLSKSTAEYDRGEKLEHYQRVPSLEAIVLVDHEHERVDLRTRREGEWVIQPIEAGGLVALSCVGATLAVDDIYAAARDA